MHLKINVQIIEQVSTYTYLWVTIDKKLHWSDYINQTNDSILSGNWISLR